MQMYTVVSEHVVLVAGINKEVGMSAFVGTTA